MNDIQKELFTIYLETKKVCNQLGIKLIASGGTLLGAIRHKGFIPWDNDMDFYLLRKDYDRFCKEAPKLIDKKYFVQCHKTDHDWYINHCKIRENGTTALETNPYAKFHQGLWIDIFPIDALPDNKKIFLKYIVRCRELYERIAFHWMQQRSRFKTKIIRLIIGFYNRMLLKHPFLNISFKKIEKESTKYNKLKSEYLCISLFLVTTSYSIGRLFIYSKKIFDDILEVPFENSTVFVMKDYDSFLTQQYGNWRQIPPPEKRKASFHNIVFLDLKKDYREYIKDKKFLTKHFKKN